MYMHDIAKPKWHPVVLEARDRTRYLVSNTGLVKNSQTGKLLKPWYDHSGYAKVKVYYSPNDNGVGYDMVYRIKKGLNWVHISSCYPELGISRSDTTNQDKLG